MMGVCMKRAIQILGLNIDNYSLREELGFVQNAFADHRFRYILTVSMQTLLLTGTNPAVKDCVEQADLIVVDDVEILKQAKIYSNQRNREIEEQLFMKEFMKRMVRSERKLFLVAQTDRDVEKLKKFLSEKYEKLQIIGQYSIEACSGDLDHLINEINSASIDVVISVLPSPVKEEFLNDAKNKIDAKIWYSIGENYALQQEQMSLGMRIRYWFHKRWFKLHVNNYQETNNNEKHK